MRELGSNASLDRCRRRGITPGRVETSIWPSIYPALLELVRGAPLDDRLREQPPARRAARAAAERARGGGSRARAPRLAGARAAGADRGGSEGGADPVPRRDVVARARHRHGRRRPRRPGRVAEVGRARPAAHRPRRAIRCDEVSKGRIFPKFRADLLECAVVAQRMREGAIEETQIPRNPLDVLAQQIVGICAREEIEVADLHRLVRGAYPVRRPLARAARERARHARRAAIRRTSSPSCGRASSGTAPPA